MRIACWLALAVSVSLPACKEAPPTTAPPAESPPAAVVVELRAALARAGIEVTDARPLAGHTQPSRCSEEWRYRLDFGGLEFLNVNRFPDDAAARDCFDEYRRQVAKGGPAALDRLMPFVGVDGPYLFQFSEATHDGRRREEILAAVKEGLAAANASKG